MLAQKKKKKKQKKKKLPTTKSTYAHVGNKFALMIGPKNFVHSSISKLGPFDIALSASSCLWSFNSASACKANILQKCQKPKSFYHG